MLVIIVGAITAAVVIRTLADSLSSSQIGLSFSQTYKARSLANACVEKALRRIHNGDFANTDSGNITFTNGNCIYSVSDISGGNISISATGTSGRSIITETVTGTVSGGNITINDWK